MITRFIDWVIRTTLEILGIEFQKTPSVSVSTSKAPSFTDENPMSEFITGLLNVDSFERSIMGEVFVDAWMKM